jgi:hypothetical protein
MVIGTLAVAKKKPEPAVEPSKVTIKIKADLHRKARTVASHRDVELIDYIDELLRPLVEKHYADMAREIQGE